MAAGLELRDLVIAYGGAAPVLRIEALDLPSGATLGVGGPSGAGKSSLLHALAGIERPHAGQVRWGDVAIWDLRRADLDRWRRQRLGLVFQDMHLVDGLSALDNVVLPILFDRRTVPADLRTRAEALLDRLGVAAGRGIGVMSRGERQRVALARALLRSPGVLLADEPTASLDHAAADAVGALLIEAAHEAHATLIVTTHDPALLARMGTRMRLAAGRLEAVA